MARTQIKHQDIQNRTLTGASFDSALEFYDETKSYNVDDVVIWKTSRWIATASIPSTDEGDLQYAPENNTDWKKLVSIIWNAYPSNVQTFNDTAVVLLLDTIREPDSFNRITLDSTTGIVTFNTSGTLVAHLEFSAKSTTTTRTISKAWLEFSTDGGNTWTIVENSTVWTYNRTTNQGITTGAVDIPLNINNGDKLRVSMVCTTSTNIDTVADACNLTIFNVEGASGPKGEKGDTGQPGDIIWTGEYDSSKTYNENEAVQYLGSSYVSVVNNNTETPSETSNNWDLVAKKGDPGSGTSVSIADEGTDINNTPHSTLNFKGEYVTATDAGNGVADITISPTKQEYMVVIWAEENAALSDDTYEWAFGNGGNTAQNNGCPIFVPNGYTVEVVALGLNLNAGSAEVELVVNGTETGNTVSADVGAGTKSAIQELTTPYQLANAARLNFKTVTAANTSASNIATAWIRYKEN